MLKLGSVYNKRAVFFSEKFNYMLNFTANGLLMRTKFNNIIYCEVQSRV
ncbi:hypothetical protein OIU78_029106 [Salix suchowensis]|nr:hypothetical protein OIU78_029106 [Salix suchowensis]